MCEIIQTALQRAGQNLARQQAVHQYVQLLQQQQQQQQQQSQPSQQSQFSQLTKPIASVNQPSLILRKHQALHLQNIPQQQQRPPVFHPGSIAQQPAPTKLVQSLVPTPVLPPAVATTSNSTEHVSPEGYKYYYNSITSEKARYTNLSERSIFLFLLLILSPTGRFMAVLLSLEQTGANGGRTAFGPVEVSIECEFLFRKAQLPLFVDQMESKWRSGAAGEHYHVACEMCHPLVTLIVVFNHYIPHPTLEQGEPTFLLAVLLQHTECNVTVAMDRPLPVDHQDPPAAVVETVVIFVSNVVTRIAFPPSRDDVVSCHPASSARVVLENAANINAANIF
ncbi:hypothetical protein SELMODRAFT_429944 [Selaginella moellendorffii]|uniref:Uncharacterized protein n=1 Tax=Selaginella moellendorffii TaxID=88036 RepID=D8T7U8_SELML|nr:hypothetical protein SELMODRAFT_429944 [Selaginella moellendorffii]